MVPRQQTHRRRLKPKDQFRRERGHLDHRRGQSLRLRTLHLRGRFRRRKRPTLRQPRRHRTAVRPDSRERRTGAVGSQVRQRLVDARLQRTQPDHQVHLAIQSSASVRTGPQRRAELGDSSCKYFVIQEIGCSGQPSFICGLHLQSVSSQLGRRGTSIKTFRKSCSSPGASISTSNGSCWKCKIRV